MKFSELMKAERKSQRITLRALSAKSGVEFCRLADFDAGRAEPYGEEKDNICKALGIYHQEVSAPKMDLENFSKLNVMMRSTAWVNRKTSGLYIVTGVAYDATNSREGNAVVIYQNKAGIFCRDLFEFEEKFTPTAHKNVSDKETK